jgi:sugar phosphate permease
VTWSGSTRTQTAITRLSVRDKFDNTARGDWSIFRPAPSAKDFALTSLLRRSRHRLLLPAAELNSQALTLDATRAGSFGLVFYEMSAGRRGTHPRGRVLSIGMKSEPSSGIKLRWWVCFLLFAIFMMSYVDRSLMPLAIPFIAREFQISPVVAGAVLSAFFAGYALMQIPGGLVADRIGSRKTVTIGITAWSLFSALTGTAGNLSQMIWIRICFGLCEGVFPPAALKALAVWFPRDERTRASAVLLSSNTIGPMVAPVLFATGMSLFGWRGAFLAISIPGFLLAAAAYWYIRDHPAEHPKISLRELEEIGKEGRVREQVSLLEVLHNKSLWKLFLIYGAWDATWWGFQSWLPSYLVDRGFTIVKTSAAASLPYAAGFLGMLISARISERMQNRRAVLFAVLLGNAVSMLLISMATTNTMAVILLTAAGFFLPAIHGPFWSLPMDMLPSHVIGVSAGFLNTAGQLAGLAAPMIIGALVEWTGHYQAAFVFMAISAGASALLVLTLREQKTTQVEVSS